ncbi:MAG TPA: DUF6776 family protein [Casimicrobiaceae bacterium]|jgi:hypothetical protein|nr:DUF6776 family protein [Casimicrobiaceae bacterium]
MPPTMRAIGRRVRQTFGISAPRMAVRTHLSWRWKAPALIALLLIPAGMWWWGFDFGQFLSGFNRGAVEQRQEKLEAEAATASQENAKLRARAAELESDLNVTRGAQATLSKQALDLQNENSQMKEELAFLRTLFSESGKPGAFAIQRLAAERERDGLYHFSMLVVRGGKPIDDFNGQLSLSASVVVAGHTSMLILPDDQPETAPSLKLQFKYYQRIEGSFRVPPGAQVKSLQARVLEAGQTAPKATRSLNLS